MDEKIEAALAKVRALCSSLECLLDCCLDLEEKSQALGSAVFLVRELKEAIALMDDQIRGWSTAAAPAND